MTRLVDVTEFDSFEFNERKETLTSVDKSGKYIIKIQVVKNPRKAVDVRGEFEVMSYLNSKGCQSCPKAYEYGEDLPTSLKKKIASFLPSEESVYPYIIQEFVVSEGNYSLADLLLSIIEQKKLGVFQGDVKPNNVRFNSKSGVCVLIDYDQSLRLSDPQKSMSNVEFFKFCDENDKLKYGIGNWLRHWPGVSNEHVRPFLQNGSLNLANTALLRLQKTTNSMSGIYHTIDSPDVFAIGSRGLDRRAEILDVVSFDRGERVLDVGCNAGLLCEYLHDRGCKVVGVDNDPHIVIAAKMISNILGREIEYAHMDLDYADEIGVFDTVMLFSVFHHTRNTTQNAMKIVRSCKRIIIETRLIENGKQPVDGQWVDTTRWNFQSLDQLISYLEQTFVGFKFKTNLGFADKGRYVLELVKQ